MPRIRTLKPDHRQHRKVGALSDQHYRLWVSMILEADDEGRLVCDPSHLRAMTFGFQRKVTVAHVEDGVRRLAELGLVRLYRVASTWYADFHSWTDHQRINRPTPSKLPAFQDSAHVAGLNGSLNIHGAFSESSLNAHAEFWQEGKGRELEGNKTKTTPPAPPQPGGHAQDAGLAPLETPSQSADWDSASWPSPEALAAMYNRLTPDNCPAVETLSTRRRQRAQKWLRDFPQRSWWEQTFAEYHESRFLSGRTPPRVGHESFRPTFDWLLANGRDGAENAVKVHDGQYREGR